MTGEAPPRTDGSLLAIGELFTAGVRATADSAGILLGIWAACALPSQLLGLALRARLGLNDAALNAAIEARDWSVLGPSALVGAIGLGLGLVGFVSALTACAGAHRGRPLSTGDALLAGVERAASAAAASVMVAGAGLAGLLLAVVPGLYLMPRLSLSLCAVAVDGAGPLEAASRSWTLTRGRFWAVTGRELAFASAALAGMCVVLLAAYAIGAAAGLAGGPAPAAARVLMGAVQFMLTSWTGACMTRLYLDLSANSPA